MIAGLSGTPNFAHGDGPALAPLTVVHPWSRATAPSQKTGAVFLRIENPGAHADRLIAVESNLAKTASLHTMIRDGDVMKMRPIDGGIDVPARGHAELAPGGKHIMLVGLQERLVEGSTVPLALIFERAGRMAIEAVVEAAGARGPSASDGHRRRGTPER